LSWTCNTAYYAQIYEFWQRQEICGSDMSSHLFWFRCRKLDTLTKTSERAKGQKLVILPAIENNAWIDRTQLAPSGLRGEAD
jgi:hypothetical protein